MLNLGVCQWKHGNDSVFEELFWLHLDNKPCHPPNAVHLCKKKIGGNQRGKLLHIYRKSIKAWIHARSLFTGHQGHGTHIHTLWHQRCQHWLKIYMGSPHTPAGVTQESVAREGWMTNNNTAQGRSEWGLILGAVKNRKGRVKGKRLTESTVGRGRHTVRGKGTIFPVIFKHIYNTLLHMSGAKNTGWD